MLEIVKLAPGEWEQDKALRLRALRAVPEAFGQA
jgi:hypothetical protein